MSTLATCALIVYASWRSMNAYQSYLHNKKMTIGNILEICFSFLMCYWLITPSALFLVAKIIDGLFALGLGLYLGMLDGPKKFLLHREKVVNGYWNYAITDAAICFICFFISVTGHING